jgi:hypothetical protein
VDGSCSRETSKPSKSLNKKDFVVNVPNVTVKKRCGAPECEHTPLSESICDNDSGGSGRIPHAKKRLAGLPRRYNGTAHQLQMERALTDRMLSSDGGLEDVACAHTVGVCLAWRTLNRPFGET